MARWCDVVDSRDDEHLSLVMMNIPSSWTRNLLLEKLALHRIRSGKEILFVHVPCEFDSLSHTNLGYAFLHMSDDTAMEALQQILPTLLPKVTVHPAKIRGLENLHLHFTRRRTQRVRNPKCRPVFFA